MEICPAGLIENCPIRKEAPNGLGNEYLLRFTDFFYAALVTLVVKSFFEDLSTLAFLNPIPVITDASILDRMASLLMMVGVFYFILDDWIDSRNSNARIGYDGYLRFFLDIVIALSAYGCIFFGVKRNLTIFLLFVAITHLLITFWLIRLHKECVKGNFQELLFGKETNSYILVYELTNLFFSIASSVFLITCYFSHVELTIDLLMACYLIVIGGAFLFIGEYLEYSYMPEKFSQNWSPSIGKKLIKNLFDPIKNGVIP